MTAARHLPGAATAQGPRLGSPEIFGYYPYWDLGAHIDYGAITTIAYFGLGAGEDGRLVRRTPGGRRTIEYSRWLSGKVSNVISEAHANGVKFVLTVERMAWTDGGKAATRRLLNSRRRRALLVADIVREIQARGIDGVSLDFEPILSDQRSHFAEFVRELRAGLDVVDPFYQLTFAATGSQSGLNYQMIGDLTASGAADAVIVMGYPLRAINARYAGGLAPLRSPTSHDLNQIAKAYLARVAPDKMVMALPWYGRQWPTTTSEVNALVRRNRKRYDRPHNIDYSVAIELAQTYGRRVDPIEQSAWTVFRWRYRPGTPWTWKEVYYDDVETLGYKFDWIMAKGMAGIGIFALGYDDAQPELWKLLRVKYRGLIDTVAPIGSAVVVADEELCASLQVRVLLSADDGVDGSGLVFVRLSNTPDVGSDGALVSGRTHPTTSEVGWPLDDPSVGEQTVYAQWRDVAGNWSPVTSAPFSFSCPV